MTHDGMQRVNCSSRVAGGDAAARPAPPSREEASNLSAPSRRGEVWAGVSTREVNDIAGIGGLDDVRERRRVESRRARYQRRLGLRRAYARAPELQDLRTVEGYLPRLARCGHTCRTGTVEVRVQNTDQGRRGYLAGLEACGSVWACPVCSAKLWARRRDELAQVAAWATGEGARSWLMTLTVRHRARHDLRALVRGIAEAWSKFISGRFWLHFQKWAGSVGYVRRLEITWGRRHGWHPHLHIQFHLTRDLDDAAWSHMWRARLAMRWRECVERVLGQEHVPTLERGCDMRAHDRAGDYIGESSLELTDADAKRARRSSRLSIAQLADLVASGVHREASRSARERYSRVCSAWREYVAATRGARALTWSCGLRRRAGLIDDEQAADEAADALERARAPVVATLEGQRWSERTRWRALEICALLEAGERGDVDRLVVLGCDAPESWDDARAHEARAG